MNIPEVVQVVPQEDYTVDVLFYDGKKVKYNVFPLLNKGLFTRLKDRTFYVTRCTVLNGTLAWDLSGKYDPYNCIDIDPVTIYNA